MATTKVQLTEDQLQKFMLEEVDRLRSNGHEPEKAVRMVIEGQVQQGNADKVARTVGWIGLYDTWKRANAADRRELMNPTPDAPTVTIDPIRRSTSVASQSIIDETPLRESSAQWDGELRIFNPEERKIAAPPPRTILDSWWKVGSTWVPLRIMTGANCKAIEDFYRAQKNGMARMETAFHQVRAALPSDEVVVGDHLSASRLEEIFQGIDNLQWSRAS